jgi:hypothetical protein
MNSGFPLFSASAHTAVTSEAALRTAAATVSLSEPLALFEVGKFFKRKGLFQPFFKHHAAVLRNGKLAVDHYGSTLFRHRGCRIPVQVRRSDGARQLPAKRFDLNDSDPSDDESPVVGRLSMLQGGPSSQDTGQATVTDEDDEEIAGVTYGASHLKSAADLTPPKDALLPMPSTTCPSRKLSPKARRSCA